MLLPFFHRKEQSLTEANNEEIRTAVQSLIRLSTNDYGYYLFLILSILITTAGLLLDSPPVIIGGMIIAPIITPLLACGLAALLLEVRGFMRAVSIIILSAFFAQAGNLTEEHREIKEPEKASTLLHPILRDRKEETEAFLREQIENFSLSPSALNDFLEDPQLFVQKHLLRFPEARNPSYAYGNAIHHVLADWGISIRNNDPMSEEVMQKKFREHLELREVLTGGERKRLEKLGCEALAAFYDRSLKDAQPHIHKVECELRAHLGDIPLKGKIDRIDLAEPDDARATIYDYKTGKPKAPTEIEKMGYKRQLIFYDLIVHDAMPLLKPQQYILSFVGEDGENPIDRAFSFSDEDRQELAETIKKVWAKIVALDFTKL